MLQRRYVAILTVVLGALLTGALLAACGSNDDDGNSGTSSEEVVGYQSREGNAALQTKVTSENQVKRDKVAVFVVGSQDDRSYANTIAVGARAAADNLEQYGVEVALVDNLAEPAQYERQANAFLDRGFTGFVFAYGAVPDVVQKLAAENPDAFFIETNTEIDPLPSNAAVANPEFQYGTFLAGVLAADVSQTDHVGAVSGPAFPVLTSSIEGFILGARWVNPDIDVSQAGTPNFTEVGPAKAAAAAQIGAGADVLLSATDQATQGMYQAASQASNPTYVIPQYWDSYDLAPDVVLTSVLMNMNGMIEDLVNKLVTDEIESKTYAYGPEQDVGVLAPLRDKEDVPSEETMTQLDEVRAMIDSGELEVPFLGQPGEGEKYDLSKLPPPPPGPQD